MLPSHLYASLCQLRPNRAHGDTLMRQVELSFNAEDLLHVYTVVQLKRKPSTPFFKVTITCTLGFLVGHKRVPSCGGRSLLIPKGQWSSFGLSEECKAAIRAVNKRRALRKVTNLLTYEPVYCHIIPHKDDEFGRIRLPALFMALTVQVEAEPNLSEAPLLDKQKEKQFVGGPSKKSKKKKGETSSAFLPSSNVHAELCLVVAQAVILPKDVANLTKEGSEEIHNLLVMQQEGWLPCLRELGIPFDNPTWTVTPPEVKPVDPPQAYSPLMLPSFNEEELLKEMADEVPEMYPEVVGDLIQDTVKASAAAENGSNGDVSPDL
ncbi:hypothetical protein Acr_18g0009120 [Actinidia rufa]|uniref:Uncharacterized protein n=1 Tax=Actinidia rufa TaxID=165716 RepID=A0A7J0G7P2_9ERIC|nr:hypothetical protein Acr_18g0009120 [Actinidia rufa]